MDGPRIALLSALVKATKAKALPLSLSLSVSVSLPRLLTQGGRRRSVVAVVFNVCIVLPRPSVSVPCHRDEANMPLSREMSAPLQETRIVRSAKVFDEFAFFGFQFRMMKR